MTDSVVVAARTPPVGGARLAIGLVALAHACSHFFMLVLPPLFPFLVADFQVSYTELGLVMSIYFLASGVGQPIAGFLVDRYGARALLFGGLFLYWVAICVLAFLPEFWLFYPVMALAGIANSVFHPADYTVLSASVPHSHLGRAFSVHTLGGNLGWVLAPVFMLTIAEFGGWKLSIVAAGMLGLAIWLLLWLYRDVLRDERSAEESAQRQREGLGLSFIFSSTVVLCFWYFVLLAAALIAVQNFIGPILESIHTVSLVVAGAALTGFLIGASTGVIAGGIAADKTGEHAWVIVGGLAGSACLVVSLAYMPSIGILLIGVLFCAGFLSGMTSPSRDMLVRQVTPKGATGRVFGVVYSGLDVGSALAPVTVGYMLDKGLPTTALWVIGATILCGVLTVVGIRGQAHKLKADVAAV